MDDLNATTPATEPEVAPAQEAEVQSEPQEPDENQDGLTEEELEDLAFAGKQYRLPKEIAAAVVKAENADAVVTRKTQALADERKALHAEREQVQREAETNNALINEVAQLKFVEQRIQQFQNVDWQAWQASNPQAAQAGLAEYTQLKDAQGQISRTVEGRKAELEASMETRKSTAISHAMEALSKPDPSIGWDGKFDDTKRKDMRDYLMKKGFQEATIAGIDNPEIIRLVHLAQIGEKSLAQQRTAAAPPRATASPVPMISAGKSRTSLDPEKMTQAQFNKWRESTAKGRPR